MGVIRAMKRDQLDNLACPGAGMNDIYLGQPVCFILGESHENGMTAEDWN